MASLCIRIKNFTLLSNNQRLFSPMLRYDLVTINDFHLIVFHQMISISDCLCKLGCMRFSSFFITRFSVRVAGAVAQD